MRGRIILALALLVMVATVPSFTGSLEDMTLGKKLDSVILYDNTNGPNNPNSYLTSSDILTGILDPIEVEQQAFVTSGNLSAKTDTNPLESTDLPIDTIHDWMGSQAGVDVWNLERLYAVNGSFDEGISGSNLMPTAGNVTYHPLGWDADSDRSGIYEDELQLAGYDTSGSRYIIVENQGGKVGQKEFGHTAGTYVAWSQTIDNAPYTEDFMLNLDYFYLRGPIDSPYGLDPFPGGNCTLQLMVDGSSIWNMSLLLLTQRGLWENTGDIPIHISGAPSSFLLEFGLFIDETMILDIRHDYDGDPLHLADGIGNAVYITVFIDEFSFIKATPPNASDVELEFSVESTTVPITGVSGEFSASIVNASYWRESPITVYITSNTSVSFNYEARLRSHRFSNSSSTSRQQLNGVAYIIDCNHVPELSAHTYIGSLGEYENLSLALRYPHDWTNLIVYDPFLMDVTSQCIISDSEVWIPQSLTSRLGWWDITFQAPNYVQSIQTQKLTLGGWEIAGVYRSTNTTQVSISIGTATSTPSSLNAVNVSWKYPNSSIWVQESLNGGVQGEINSSAHVLGPSNTTAGEWSVEVFWKNGTEIGYSSSQFALYHASYLEAINPSILAESGIDELVTGFVRFRDADNGEYLMNPDASIQANWSGSIVPFSPNEIKNRWEGDFETDLADGGVYTTLVNASLPYYDYANCTFTITVNLIDNSLTLLQSSAGMNLFSTFEATFEYKDRFGIGIDDANISIEVPEKPEGLFIDEPKQAGPGTYSFNITSLQSGTYEVIVTAWKDYYEEAEDGFFLSVGKIGTDFYSLNGTGGLSQIGQTYRLVLRYENSSGSGLVNATISVISMTPSIGIIYTNVTQVGQGDYSVVLTPTSSGTYTLLARAEVLNHQEQIIPFTINAPKIASSLTIIEPPSSISIDQTCNLVFNFSSAMNGGIEFATIEPLNVPQNLGFSSLQELGDGMYSINIIPYEIGSYQIVFRATVDDYLDASAAFTLQVTNIETRYTLIGGFPDTNIEYLSSVQISVLFERIDNGANISEASVGISFLTFENISSSIRFVDDIYIITFVGDMIGHWDLIIKFTKPNYQTQTIELTVKVNQIPAVITRLDSNADLVYGRSAILQFKYSFAENESGIVGAAVTISGILSEWVSVVDVGNGYYNLTISAYDIGTYSPEITFVKEGYQYRKFSFSISVRPISVYIEMNPLEWEWGKPLKITLTLEDDNGYLVTGAILTYRLFVNQIEADSGIIPENSDLEGNYTIEIRPAWSDGSNYRLNITLNKQFHTLETAFSQPIFQRYPPDYPLQVILTQYTPPIALIGFIGLVVGSSYRVYRKREAEKFQRALAAKKRFDDVDSLIGIIVLHKKSGLAVYSNILKGGFEESMISAFITAITHFRGELDKSEEDWIWEVIPISDIIRIVPTLNLICAFITISPASMAQEKLMVKYAKSVGVTLDSTLEEAPYETLDSQSIMMLDDYFEDIMDGYLLYYYKRGTAEVFPKRFRCLETVMLETGIQECARPIHLARNMTDCGMSEAEACLNILDAIKQELIVPCQDPEIHTHDTVDWGLFEEEDSL